MKEGIALSKSLSADVYLYNGTISRDYDYKFIETVERSKKHSTAILFLVTDGGDPDAGYKMSRFMQGAYDRHTVAVCGMCKSAGTLIAIGAHELAFSKYGELGPLDVQTYKTDNLAERQSGLTIQEALDALTAAAVRKHGQVFSSIISATNAIVSFPTAAKASAELVNGLFSPIFGQIDPYDVGDKARAMRIATTYGARLSANTKNLKPKTLDTLTKTYPSHSFVIDLPEATELFNNVRSISAAEQAVADALKELCRVEARASQPVIICLSEESTNVDGANKNVTSALGRRGKGGIAKNSGRTKRARSAPNKHSGPSQRQPLAGSQGNGSKRN